MMFHHLLEAVREVTSGERALDSVRDLARFHRVQASPGYDQAARWLTTRLESYGFEPEVETVPGDGHTRFLGQLMPEGWECTSAFADLIDGEHREPLCDYGAEKLSLVLRSAPARGRFRLVAIEDGTEDRHYDGLDLRGAMVLTGGNVYRVHTLAVIERGAAGVLSDGRRLVPPVRDRFDDPDALAYTSFWWSGDEPRGWGFVVSPRRGQTLRERLKAGARLEVEVAIESRRFPTPIPLISATLGGQRPGEILVVGHLCHPQPSANDNASGAAAVLETARVLSVLRARGVAPDSGFGMRFLWVPELTGTYAWLARDPARAAGIVAALNLDMVGQDQEQCGSTFLLEHAPCFAASFAAEILRRIREQAVDWVPSYSGPGHYSMTRMAEVPYSGGSDHAVLIDPAFGIPCPMLIQWPDRFYHSSHDTPDKSDPRSLALAVRCAATYAGFLAGSGDPERRWMVEAVGRGARRAILKSLDSLEPARELERARLAGRCALESLGRLNVDRETLDRARKSLDRFIQGEAPGDSSDSETQAAPGGGVASGVSPRPRRKNGAPLDYQRHLIDGYADLPRAEREQGRRLDQEVSEGRAVLELAWYACDGRRSLEDIARLVCLECGTHDPEAIRRFFEWTARLGVSEWVIQEEGTWSPSAPATASP